MKTLDDTKLIDTLPSSISKDEKVAASTEALDPQFKRIAEKVDIPSLYLNIDRLPSKALDHLATQYDVTVWRDSWNDTLKRNVLKQAISDKRKKGTLSAVKKAVESLGSAVEIVEWWQKTPKGEPYTFTITATLNMSPDVVTDEMQEDLMSMIDDAKPLRSHYDFILQRGIKGGIGIYAHMRAITYNTIG